jgi:hypothetical protein
MRRRKVKNDIPVTTAIFLLVVGLLLGSICVFGMQHWNKPIEKDEALPVSATFESYHVSYTKRFSIKEIKIIFSDYDPIYIDSACANDDILSAVKSLRQGDTLEMLIHPNSNTAWELEHNGNIILPFENAQHNIKIESHGFFFLGLFMYFCAAYAAISLLTKCAKHKKRKQRNRHF